MSTIWIWHEPLRCLLHFSVSDGAPIRRIPSVRTVLSRLLLISSAESSSQYTHHPRLPCMLAAGAVYFAPTAKPQISLLFLFPFFFFLFSYFPFLLDRALYMLFPASAVIHSTTIGLTKLPGGGCLALPH